MDQSPVVQKIKTFLMQGSPRERALAIGGGVLLSLAVVYLFVVEPAEEAFARQSKDLAALETTYLVAPDILGRYGKLVARRKEIEQFYENVDLGADPITHLEKLLREVAKVPSGAYSISTREGTQLGGKYTHKIFVVKFETASLNNLAAFLKDLTTGQQPMLLTQINLEKRISGEILQVQLEVSAFEVVQK